MKPIKIKNSITLILVINQRRFLKFEPPDNFKPKKMISIFILYYHDFIRENLQHISSKFGQYIIDISKYLHKLETLCLCIFQII